MFVYLYIIVSVLKLCLGLPRFKEIMKIHVGFIKAKSYK